VQNSLIFEPFFDGGFMNQERESQYNDREYLYLIDRYKSMLRSGKNYFFDVHEFEMLIEHFLQFGDLENASNAIDMAINQHPCSGELVLRKAQVLIDKGESPAALDILNNVQKSELANYELYLLKGIASNFIGKQKDAKKYFAQAIEIAGENIVDTLFSIAVNYENLSKYEKAYEYLQKANSEEDQNLTILSELGNCSERLNDYSSAINWYNNYLDIDPFSDSVWFNLGVAFSKALNFEKAVEAFDFAIAINEKYALAYYNKGNALVNLSKYTEAIEAYKEYLAFDDSHAETLCYMGECYERTGKIGLAVEHYNKALEIDPKFSDAIYGLGIIQSIKENYKESVDFILKAIEINPESSDYWFSLGNVYSKLNLVDKAITAYHQSTALDPQDYESWLNLSELYYKKNLLSKAIKTLEEAYVFNADVALINYRLAAYNLLKHNVEEGIEYFRKGMDSNFDEHDEVLKFYPAAINIKGVSELIQQYNSIKQ
jgi:tetratricopeptide (TPR) repeat protein